MRNFSKLLAPVTLIFLVFLIVPWAKPCAQGVPQSGSSPNGPSGSQATPGQVVVRLAQPTDLPDIASAYGLDPLPVDQFRSQPIYLLRITDGVLPGNKAGQLMNDPLRRVTYAEPNEVGQAPEGESRTVWGNGVNEGNYVTQWADSIVRLSAAHSVATAAGITVAVLDTGVDFQHPALVGRLLPGYDFVDNDPDPSEVGAYGVNLLYGHGTHIAGLVAHVAPGAKIMPIRVLDPNGQGNTWVVAKAIAYAVDPDGDPLTNDGADIVNLSLSGVDDSSLLRDVIAAATCSGSGGSSGGSSTSSGGPGGSSGGPSGTSSGSGGSSGGASSTPGGSSALPCLAPNHRVIIVAAAGNNNSSTPAYPAADGVAGLISVGASDQNDKLAGFSNFGSWVMVAAPGEHITSSVPGGGYGTWSGTSMAAPFVSGEAALVLATYPGLSIEQVIQQIILTGKNIGSPVPQRIDAASAVGVPQ